MMGANLAFGETEIFVQPDEGSPVETYDGSETLSLSESTPNLLRYGETTHGTTCWWDENGTMEVGKVYYGVKLCESGVACKQRNAPDLSGYPFMLLSHWVMRCFGPLVPTFRKVDPTVMPVNDPSVTPVKSIELAPKIELAPSAQPLSTSIR
jgi:hypothetical protein